jgi:hypothetical protein
MKNGKFENDHSGTMFDALLELIGKTADRDLRDITGLCATAISRIRNGLANVSGDVKITVHKKTGWSIDKIERMLPKKPAPVKRAKKAA